jgi:hypothetical protein
MRPLQQAESTKGVARISAAQAVSVTVDLNQKSRWQLPHFRKKVGSCFLPDGGGPGTIIYWSGGRSGPAFAFLS